MSGPFTLSFVLRLDCIRCLSSTLRNSKIIDLGGPRASRFLKLHRQLEGTFKFYIVSKIISLSNKVTNCPRCYKDIPGFISKRSKEVIWRISLISCMISQLAKPGESINYFYKELLSVYFSYTNICSPHQEVCLQRETQLWCRLSNNCLNWSLSPLNLNRGLICALQNLRGKRLNRPEQAWHRQLWEIV